MFLISGKIALMVRATRDRLDLKAMLRSDVRDQHLRGVSWRRHAIATHATRRGIGGRAGGCTADAAHDECIGAAAVICR